MNPEVWDAILSAWDDLGRCMAPSVTERPRDAAGKLPLGDVAVLERIRASLRARLGDLAVKLRELIPDLHVLRQVLEPLVIHTDERMLVRLPPALGASWVRLQHDIIHSDDGGVVFYDHIDRLLAEADPPRLVLEVYHFCLAEGFCGKWVHDPAKLDEYKRRLATAIRGTPELQPASTPARLPPPIRAPKTRAYYAVAIVVALLVPFVARAIL